MPRGKVFLIGAGPGDPELITLRGLRCIQKADVVVYDRLISPRLLSWARSGAELVYVGKQPDRHVMSQHQINRLLVEKAVQGKIVARLKGGDPFVFGRGGEEAEALAEAGVSFEVVPGVTSAIAAPAYAGIPVTHRRFASSLAIIAGNEDPSKEDSRIKWDKIATGAETLIFLMGMSNLSQIVEKLISCGRSPLTPVALVRWGTRPEQQTLTGNLADIVARAEAAGFKNPAVILVGEVALLRNKLQWYEKKPLFGKRVLITRSRAQAGELSDIIAELGGEPLEFPTISIVDPQDFTPLDGAIFDIGSYQWIIFTSVNGVKAFFRRLDFLKRDIRDLKGVKLGAIGPKTARALEEKGLRVDFTPAEYRAEEVVEGVRHLILPGEKVLLPRADIARPFLARALEREIGAVVNEVVAYRTMPGGGDVELVRQLLEKKSIHVITFTSSSTVKNFAYLMNHPDLPELLNGTVIACIGPVTAATAEEMGLRVDIQARHYTIEGLVEAIVNYYSRDGG